MKSRKGAKHAIQKAILALVERRLFLIAAVLSSPTQSLLLVAGIAYVLMNCHQGISGRDLALVLVKAGVLIAIPGAALFFRWVRYRWREAFRGTALGRPPPRL